MVFLVRATEAPSRTLREIDETGVERTFWLWRDGPWVVCARLPSGDVSTDCSPDLLVELHDGGSVMVAEVTYRDPFAGRDTAPDTTSSAEP